MCIQPPGLVETSDAKKIWPEETKSKTVKVGFEVTDGGRQMAVNRLAKACAYCITRYFYDCSKYEFKISDERMDKVWQDWME